MRKFAKLPSNRHQKTARFLSNSALALVLFTSLGCGIPSLRSPLPGPVVPGNYALNNGRLYVPPATTTTSGVKKNLKDEQEASDNTLSPTRVQLVSYITTADPSADPIQQSQASILPPATAPQVVEEAPSLEVTPDQTDSKPLEAGSQVVNPPVDQNGFEVVSEENSSRLPQEIFFNDPYLNALIRQALTDNQELKKLSEEIQIARNEVFARSGEYLPFVSLGTGVGIDKSGKYTTLGAVEDQLDVAPGRSFPDPLPDFLTAGNLSWEIDIWYKLRNAQRAASMRFLGTQEGRNYVITRLVAEIAENYYSLLALDVRLETLDKTIAIQRESLRNAEANKLAGRGTELPVQRFAAEIQKNEAQKSVLLQEIVQIENRINFLLGRYPQQVERIRTDFIDLNLNALGSGIPSELLQQRADIRQAERQVEAAGLDLKVAKARFYPSLNLTGGLGWNAFSTGYLLKTPDSLMYNLAGDLVGPLINKRAIKAAYCSANAAQLESIYNYQQTVLRAHIEVVNQITKVENYRRTIEAKKLQLQALEKSVNAAFSLWRNNFGEYVEVLLVQREMMEARMQLIEVKREQLSAIINAYQALGGGAF